MPTVVSILTISDKDDNEFGRSLVVVVHHPLDLLEYIHEIGASTSSNVLNLVVVGSITVFTEGSCAAVVGDRVKLLKGTLVGLELVVLFANKLSTNFQRLNWGAGHRTGSVEGLDENLALARVLCNASARLEQPIVILLRHCDRGLHERVLFVDGEVLHNYFPSVVLIGFYHSLI